MIPIDSKVSDINLNIRQHQVNNAVQRQFIGMSNNYTVDEVPLPIDNKSLKGKLKVGYKFWGSELQRSFGKLDSIYVHYHDIAKRHFFWTIWEKRTGNYNSYEEFKDNFDIDTSIFDQIFKRTNIDISNEVNWTIRRNNNLNKHVKGKDKFKIVDGLRRSNRR